jgi:hypothetical protein
MFVLGQVYEGEPSFSKNFDYLNYRLAVYEIQERWFKVEMCTDMCVR